MKYLVYKDGEREHLVVFPRSIDHDRMAEAMQALRFGGRDNWHRRGGSVVSAGFVRDGICYGKSETLGIGCRAKEDSALLYQQMEEGYP